MYFRSAKGEYFAMQLQFKGNILRLTRRYSCSLIVTGWARGTPLWARQENTPASLTVTLVRLSTEPLGVASTRAREAAMKTIQR